MLPHHWPCLCVCVCVSRWVLKALVSSSSHHRSDSIHVFTWSGTGPEPVGISSRGRSCWLLYSVFGMSRLSCHKLKGLGRWELRARAVSSSREFCLVTAVLSPVLFIGMGTRLWRVQREGSAQFPVICPSRSVVSAVQIMIYCIRTYPAQLPAGGVFLHLSLLV